MQEYGICLQTLIALRNEPSETAEMISQILFGELYEIINYNDNWVQIKLTNDSYQGWVDKKLVSKINNKDLKELKALEKIYTNNAFTYIKKEKSSQPIPIVAGSEIYLTKNKTIQIQNNTFLANEIDKQNNEISISEVALRFINAPYLWGGKSLLGIDCSGLMQILYITQGISIPRDASDQAKLGNNVSFISEAKTGDLAFFDNEEGDIIHVGMFMDSSTIIHASGWVRIDPIDHQGIYKLEEEKYSHKLRIIKRIID